MLRFAAISLATAAVLVLSFLIGNWNYQGRPSFGVPFTLGGSKPHVSLVAAADELGRDELARGVFVGTRRREEPVDVSRIDSSKMPSISYGYEVPGPPGEEPSPRVFNRLGFQPAAVAGVDLKEADYEDESLPAAADSLEFSRAPRRESPARRSRGGARFYAFDAGVADKAASAADSAWYSGGLATVDAQGVDTADTPVETPPTPPRQAKIIKTGELTIEVDNYEQSVDRMESMVKEQGGFVADGSTTEQAGGALSGRVVIRVSPERFEALFDALKAIGRVESEGARAADVTADFVDLEARIKSLKITEERLQQLIKEKSFLDEVAALLEVERELTRVRSQIEQHEGRLRVMADRIGLSTITVTLHEPARIIPSASLSVEVVSLDGSSEALSESLAKLGGRLLSGQTSKWEGGSLKGEYQVKVSLAGFARLLAEIESLGRVEQRQINDYQPGDEDAGWASKVYCPVNLVLYERSRQLPEGGMTLEIESLTGALAALDAVLESTGGSVVSNTTSRRDDGSSEARLSIRLPAGRFADLVSLIEPIGRTTAKNISGEAGRIPGGAADVLRELVLTLAERPREIPSGRMVVEVVSFPDARATLSSLVATEDLQVLSATGDQRTDGTWVGQFRLGIKATRMESVVSQLETIGRVESRQISGLLLGDLSRVDPEALGVIEFTLAEKGAIRPGPGKAGGTIRKWLRDALEALCESLGLIAYGFIILAPWLIVIFAVAWLATRLLSRRKARLSRSRE